MANELHGLFCDLGPSERWNLPLHIMERDVQASREDVFPIPTTFRKEDVAETGEMKRRAPLIEDRLSPRNPPLPAIS